MATLYVKRLTETAMLPTVAHPNEDIAFDLHADLAGASLVIPAKSNAVISTGISIEFFPLSGATIATRSSMAKKRIIVVGGIIDAGFRGPLTILLENLGDESFTINHGDRIGQLLRYADTAGKVQEVQELTKSQREERAFGSSGI